MKININLVLMLIKKDNRVCMLNTSNNLKITLKLLHVAYSLLRINYSQIAHNLFLINYSFN